VRIIWSEIAQATFVRFMADQAGQLTDDLDPASVDAEDRSDLRAVAEAAEKQVRRDEALLTPREPTVSAAQRYHTVPWRPGAAGSGPRIAHGSQPTV